MQTFRLAFLISGGQTGVDRAALDAGLALGIGIGGWCPAGRRSETGPIPDCYPMLEAAVSAYPMRTRLNVRDSDATLVFCRGTPHGGTALTVELSGNLRRPCLVIDLESLDDLQAGEQVLQWLQDVCPIILNVAGPRLSEAPELPLRVRAILQAVLRHAVVDSGRQSPVPVWPPKRPFTPDLFDSDL